MSIRPTLKQVASLAGVSYQTVSKVLNGQAKVTKDTAERIWQAVHDLGYYPDEKARNLRTRRSRMIGYSWVPLPPDQANPILDHFLQSMMDAGERLGYYILPFPHPAPTRLVATYQELISTGRVDGFIVSSVSFDDPRVDLLQQQAFPFVAFGRSNPEYEFPFVDVDGAAGLRMATEHLLQSGHRRIAALAWPESSRVGRDRLKGYLEAMEAAGITPEPAWIARGEGRIAFGRAATQRWLDGPPEERPTAIVALNDAMAVGAMQAAQTCGLHVGVDLAITGFDDAPLVQYLSPPLTSIRQPIWEIGQQVVSLLVKILQGTTPARPHILVEPHLIIRESSRFTNRDTANQS